MAAAVKLPCCSSKSFPSGKINHETNLLYIVAKMCVVHDLCALIKSMVLLLLLYTVDAILNTFYFTCYSVG